MAHHAIIIPRYDDVDRTIEDYMADHPKDVLSVNFKQRKIELRNGDMVYILVMRNMNNVSEIAGMELASVKIDPMITDTELLAVIASRTGR
jgi:hypothetical protein